MAWTQAQLDALKAAYAEGTRSVSFGDRSVTYQSQAEMAAAITTIAADLARRATPARPRVWKAYAEKGL